MGGARALVITVQKSEDKIYVPKLLRNKGIFKLYFKQEQCSIIYVCLSSWWLCELQSTRLSYSDFFSILMSGLIRFLHYSRMHDEYGISHYDQKMPF